MLWCIFHGAYLSFHLGVAVHRVHIRLTIPLISKVGHFLASGIQSSRGSMSLGFFVGLVPLGSFFFSTACFIDLSRFLMTSSLRGFLRTTTFIQSFPSPAHLAIGVSPPHSSVMEPKFVRPPLCVVGVPRHTPRGPASPPHGRSPPQYGAKGQHNWDITIINGPRHSPNFTRNFLSQQWQAHLPPAHPHEPRCSDFVGHPCFIRQSARSEGEA